MGCSGQASDSQLGCEGIADVRARSIEEAEQLPQYLETEVILPFAEGPLPLGSVVVRIRTDCEGFVEPSARVDDVRPVSPGERQELSQLAAGVANHIDAPLIPGNYYMVLHLVGSQSGVITLYGPLPDGGHYEPDDNRVRQAQLLSKLA